MSEKLSLGVRRALYGVWEEERMEQVGSALLLSECPVLWRLFGNTY